MKKFLSTMAMFALLVQVILPGAVAALDDEQAVVETTPIVQDDNGGNGATDQDNDNNQNPPSNEETQDEETQDDEENSETGAENEPANGAEDQPVNATGDEATGTGGQADVPTSGGNQASDATPAPSTKKEFKAIAPRLESFRGPVLRGSPLNPMNAFDTLWDGAESCDEENPVLGCVYGPKQSVGSFNNSGDVELRKLVTKTDNPGEYQIDIAVRGKQASTTTTTENDVCAVVVFDKSGSMKDEAGKWDNAVEGAKLFARSLRTANTKSKIGLVTFSTTADIKRALDTENLDSVDFGSAEGGTNLHAGLLKAGEMLSSSTCDGAKKYVVVMGDGEPTYYLGTDGSVLGNGNNDEAPCLKKEREGWLIFGSYVCKERGEKPSDVAKDQAELLENAGIEIFSVGYEVEADSNAEQVLRDIASEDSDGVQHYFAADASNVATAFENISESVNPAPAGTDAQLIDTLGSDVTLVDDGSNQVNIGDITEEGFVHSFKIRIDPSKEGKQATNAGVTLTYTDYQNNSQTLSLSTTETASVNWKFPACSGEKPTTANAEYGADTFSQTWENDVLTPASKTWTLNNGEGALEACEWRCKADFHAENGQCVGNKKSCDIANGQGEQEYVNGAWGECKIVSCDNTFHQEGNTCVSNTKDVDCKQAGAPANASYVMGNTTITWTATAGWSDPANCQWKCDANFHEDGGQCVSNTKPNQACNPLPENAEWISGTGVVTQTWSPKGWLPVLTGVYQEPDPTVGQELSCNFTCKANYSWNGQACEASQLTGQACTGLAEHAHWLGQGVVTQTWSETANAYLPSLTGTYNLSGNVDTCEFVCNDNYTWNGEKCVADQKPNQQCNPIPENAEWISGTGVVTQVWNQAQQLWLPSLTGNYNKLGLQAAIGSCDFRCKANYTWNGQTCEASQLIGQACTGLVEHAHWLGQGVVTQTWSGIANAYLPSLTGTYNLSGSVDACEFVCDTGFEWKNGKCEKPSNGGGSSGGGSSSGGSSGGGGSIVKDNCPSGDFSPSYYDGTCGTAPTGDDAEEVILGGEVNDCSIEGSNYSDEENIAYLYACQNDITTIKDINDARLGDFLTRAEMAKMVTQFVTSKLNKTPNAEKDCSRFDESIKDYPQDMKDFMTKSCQLDIMGVHPDYSPLSDFMPNKYVSRAEFGTILSRVLWGSAYEGTDQEWYQKHLSALKENSIIRDTNPSIVEKRSWVFMMLYRSAKALKLVK